MQHRCDEDPCSSSPGSVRVLAIGLDGAEPVWLERWMEEGALPAISELVDRGAYTRLRSIPGFSDSVWSSFYTGTGPATHGYYHHRQVKPGTVRLVPTMNRATKRPFWWLMGSMDREVVVFDVPKVPIQEQGGQVQVLGWGEHYTYHTESRPPELMGEIQKRFGRHPHYQEVFPTRSVQHEQRLLGRILRGVELRTEVTRFLMGRNPWDLFISVFSESHSAGHQFYHHLDPASPVYNAHRADAMAGAMKEAYVAIDRSLARIVEAAPPDTDVVLFSLHGLETHYVARSFIQSLLERLGYQQPPAPSGRGSRNPLGVLRDLLPQWIRDQVNARLPRSTQDELIAHFFETGCDWSRTRAFAEDSREGFPWIRINLEGREPQGIVAQGPEYDALCAELAGELMKLRIHPGGQRAVREVWRTDQVFQGPHVRDLPDLVVFWEQGTPFSAVEHPDVGLVTSDVPTIQTSQHTPRGFLAAAGPHVRSVRDIDAHIMDLAPTLLYLMGSSIPSDMEGRVLRELIAEPYLAGHPVQVDEIQWDVDAWAD